MEHTIEKLNEPSSEWLESIRKVFSESGMLSLAQAQQLYESSFVAQLKKLLTASAHIEEKYRQLNRVPGQPLSEVEWGHGEGFYRRYEHGAIYWHPQVGAHWVYGAIYQKYLALGAEAGFLGYPTIDEDGLLDGIGRFNHFQGGSIYWHPGTGAHELHGAIRDKWWSLGAERSVGYPITDETATLDSLGRFNHFRFFFEGGAVAEASIYWTVKTQAHEIHGAIRDHWASMGWEQSPLGYPTTDELGDSDERVSFFQRGIIKWFKDSPFRLVTIERLGSVSVRFSWLSRESYEHFNVRVKNLAPPWAPYGSGELGDPGRPHETQYEISGGSGSKVIEDLQVGFFNNRYYSYRFSVQGCDFKSIFIGSRCSAWVSVDYSWL